MRETFPVIVGTLVSQTLLNIVALLMLGVIIVSTTPTSSTRAPRRSSPSASCRSPLLLVVLIAPVLTRRSGSGRVARLGAVAAPRRWSRSAPG